jgi:5-methylcytosine-specific restriction enzyme B
LAIADLKSPDTIRALFSRFTTELNDQGYQRWRTDLLTFLESVARASRAERASIEFQGKIWDENKVSSVGRGSIPVGDVIADSGFRKWLADVSLAPVPEDAAAAVTYFENLYDEVVERVRPHCRKVPRLKIFRVLTALFPRHFTNVTDHALMERLHEAMFGTRGDSAVARHANVLRRLDEILGPAPSELPGLVTRMMFTWRLAEATNADDEPPVRRGPPGAERLVPLPAARRRRGLTSISGYLTPVMGTLEFVREGVSREELLVYLRSQYPGIKETSLGTVLSVLQAELTVIRRDGDRYVLTPTGESLLESEDPLVLVPWLITRILGVDHVFVTLRDDGPQLRQDLVPRIKAANPGWTSNWTPVSIVSWLKAVGCVDIASNGLVRLTDAGKEWADRIDWVPENLPREEPVPPVDAPVPPVMASVDKVVLPSLQFIRQDKDVARFPSHLVATLHAGLWAHPRRHFAIMTGLSGAGKTLLATSYARAITNEAGAADPKERICVVTVQPGWSDATALLGYVNPLRHDAYVRTRFLDFLLAGASEPTRPYVAILDEMNLSHPEQYLAPLLSAMETGGFIDLHREDDIFDGVPSRIPYPNNLVLIGTVNMDETTHGLSDKVLDRALTLEFWDIDVDQYPRWGERKIPEDVERSTHALLKALVEALAPARLHFGWRVIDDVLDFLARVVAEDATSDLTAALDTIVHGKVVPKLRGDDSTRFRHALESCRDALRAHHLRISQARVDDLLRDLETTGTARFWR